MIGEVLEFGPLEQFYATNFLKILLKGKYLQIFAAVGVFDCPDTSFGKLLLYFWKPWIRQIQEKVILRAY